MYQIRTDKRCPNNCSAARVKASIVESRVDDKPFFHCNYCDFKTYDEDMLPSKGYR
jgi:hypothetical protein